MADPSTIDWTIFDGDPESAVLCRCDPWPGYEFRSHTKLIKVDGSGSFSMLNTRLPAQRLVARSVNIDSSIICCLNGHAYSIPKVPEALNMAKPPEVSKQDFDNLASRVQTEERSTRTLESSINEVKNSMADARKDLSSKPNTRHLIMTSAIVVTLLAAILVAYSNNRTATDKSIADSLEALRRQVTAQAEHASKTNERIATVESKFELLLSTLLKNITKDIDPSKPTPTKAKLDATNALLIEAKKQDYVIDPKAIEQGGKTLLNYADLFESKQLAASAWETTTQFAVYRSFLNQKIYPVPSRGYNQMPIRIQPGVVQKALP